MFFCPISWDHFNGSSGCLNQVVKVLGLESLLHPNGRQKRRYKNRPYLSDIAILPMLCKYRQKLLPTPFFRFDQE